MNLDAKTIRMRLVEEEDAEFILALRLDENYGKYLSSTDASVSKQRQWIRRYKQDEQAGIQYYFIIERLDGVRCGTVRVYDLREDSFCWGSWILNQEKTRYAAVESAFLVYQFGFEELGFAQSHFDVMKDNQRVIAFHQKMGAEVVGEDEQNLYFTIQKADVAESKKKLSSKIQ
ncbi:GNAT family N-acetyltransferase [Halopseudomonas xiamenensis]|uniref:GNAT family N-acetyltransferase n=1 Tax=Halopseudomonas xiamenensis TaxID=157792 RepID=UPI001628176D|nr:GNAT family N-acetyltransferase [Halopseudomonas xiamenensis]